MRTPRPTPATRRTGTIRPTRTAWTTRAERRSDRLSGRRPDSLDVWSRRRLQAVVLATAVVAVAVLIGAALWVATTLAGDTDDPDTTHEPRAAGRQPGGSATDAASAREELARRPMPSSSLSEALPGPLSTKTATTLVLPAATGIGARGVLTGYPGTPEGALAQLAAIDQAALEPASVAVAQDVIAGWAQPGGPTGESWSVVAAVASLLGAAGMPAHGATGIDIDVDPVMGLIKGTVGDDFVVACIDFVVTVTTSDAATGAAAQPAQTAQVARSSVSGSAGRASRAAAADCQRMVWADGRWLIGPGDEPAPGPSLWPGTDASFEVGYRWLSVSQP